MDDTPTPGLSLRLDLGSGDHPAEGFIGVDNACGTTAPPERWPHRDYWRMVQPGDIVPIDLLSFPWPIPDDSVEAVYTSHFVEHIPAHLCHVDGNIRSLFWQEVFRVCRDRAQVVVVHPNLMSVRAFQDPTHVDFIPAQRWVYLDREWREANRLEHSPYPVGVHMVTVAVGQSLMDQSWELRAPEAQEQAARWYWNVIADLMVTLVVVKEGVAEDLPRALFHVEPGAPPDIAPVSTSLILDVGHTGA